VISCRSFVSSSSSTCGFSCLLVNEGGRSQTLHVQQNASRVPQSRRMCRQNASFSQNEKQDTQHPYSSLSLPLPEFIKDCFFVVGDKHWGSNVGGGVKSAPSTSHSCRLVGSVTQAQAPTRPPLLVVLPIMGCSGNPVDTTTRAGFLDNSRSFPSICLSSPFCASVCLFV
jgi:hypothetical protein